MKAFQGAVTDLTITALTGAGDLAEVEACAEAVRSEAARAGPADLGRALGRLAGPLSLAPPEPAAITARVGAFLIQRGGDPGGFLDALLDRLVDLLEEQRQPRHVPSTSGSGPAFLEELVLATLTIVRHSPEARLLASQRQDLAAELKRAGDVSPSLAELAELVGS